MFKWLSGDLVDKVFVIEVLWFEFRCLKFLKVLGMFCGKLY